MLVSSSIARILSAFSVFRRRRSDVFFRALLDFGMTTATTICDVMMSLSHDVQRHKPNSASLLQLRAEDRVKDRAQDRADVVIMLRTGD
jgi:hypothetical protein